MYLTKYHNRSATIVLAYLVEHEGLTLAEAVVKVFMIIDGLLCSQSDGWVGGGNLFEFSTWLKAHTV